MTGTTRVAYFVSHPIQYQAPLLRRIGREPGIDLTVFFWSDRSVRGYRDAGFGKIPVKWDVPLLDGYKSHFLPIVLDTAEPSFSRPLNSGIIRALRGRKFDVVWIHGYWNLNAIRVLLTAKLSRLPVILRAEGTLIDRPRSLFRRAAKVAFFSILRHFIAAVLPIGSRNQEYWEHYLGSAFPSFPMPYAVDNAYFQKKSSEAALTREQLREELKLAPDRPVILYASKLMPRKRCKDLVEAFLSLSPRSSGEQPCLLIVGDGEERPQLEQMVREAARDDVRFLGFLNQSQLGRVFDLCDIFVLPSVCEPFGLVVNEAMNAGRPVVVSDQVGCQPDLIKDGETGKVFRAGDIEELKRALESLLVDPDARRKMGRNALARISGWSFEEDVAGLRGALSYLLTAFRNPHPNPTRRNEQVAAVTQAE
jgi:glycosyltransferase involved in cell wall biosynthesis